MTVARAVLQRRWVHSHEEDTAGEMIFRPKDYQFPPSRGRLAFELRPDGSYVETAIGPADRPEQVTGTWDLTDYNTLAISRSEEDEPKRVMHVASATHDRLVVSR
jgi:hypothetical protein